MKTNSLVTFFLSVLAFVCTTNTATADITEKEQQREEAERESQFKNPVKIEIGKSPVSGPASAKITIVVFSDFECQHCATGHSTVEEVRKLYPNDVKITFKHNPLPRHKEAEPASRAAWTAQQQSKFWEYHAALFNNQDRLGAEIYITLAKELGLNADKFTKDMASAASVAVRGIYPASDFENIIDRW